LITTYEVRNVLRVYGNHLKKRSTHVEEISTSSGSVDLVDISMSARRRQMLSRISHQLISALTPEVHGNLDREEQTVSAPELLMNQG
jgi:hypothetical protein